MTVNGRLIYFTRFIPDVNAGGGCRRLVQMEQVFADLDVEIISARTINSGLKYSIFHRVFKDLKTKLKLFGFLEKYIVSGGEYGLWHRNHRDIVYRLNSISRLWSNAMHQSNNIKLVLLDDPIYFAPLVKKLQKYQAVLIHLLNL